MPSSVSITFIGGGIMARSLIGRLLAHGHAPEAIHVAEPQLESRDSLARDFGVRVYSDNVEAAEQGEIWLFAIKPQLMRAVSEALVATAQQRRPLIVSIAAGITSQQLQRWLGADLAVVRTMPNTPALLGAGAIGLHANAQVSPEQRDRVESLLRTTGVTAWIDAEPLMDAVTALSGSGPAYVFLLAEAMQAAGEAQGLPAETAHALTLQTIFGAARMLNESGEPAATLRQRVTTAGGTTEAAMKIFDAGGFQALFARAIAAATHRSRELSAAND